MFSHIYIEEQVREHPRTRAICARFPKAAHIACRHYGEVFNPRSQNFRLQKPRPALILARKHKRRVLPTPDGYGIGGSRNYYFSHMLNCLYDCRYCFLQGMYRSAHYVLFVNYEDFEADMDRILAENSNAPAWFFSGYDCDSLALEPVSGFAAHFLPFFEKRPDACIELRSKSTQVRGLLKREPLANAVIAFSFTPEEIYQALEHKVPATGGRLVPGFALRPAHLRGGLPGAVPPAFPADLFPARCSAAAFGQPGTVPPAAHVLQDHCATLSR
jgi:spore photoproduct lyase